MASQIENRAVFERRDVVRFYATRDALQGGEAAIFRELEPRLASLEMLDVGVGGGRTTTHFAQRVKRYVGIDYAPAMVEACRARFPDRAFELSVEDARKLPYADGAFDFVLFSHCGIDYVTDADRRRILGEIARVLRPGGTFSFSTHNLQRASSLLLSAPSEGVVERALRALGRARMRRLNPPVEELVRRDHAILNDGAFRFGARTYHVRPRAQVAALLASGFEDVRVRSARTGELLSDEAMNLTDEPWLSYDCARARRGL